MDSFEENNVTDINDFDVTPSPSVSILDDKTTSTRSVQTVRSETEQRYKIVGNISIMNQL